jgi:hypothetical protein
MLASKKTRRGVIGAVVLAGVLAIGGYALTNALIVEDISNAGDGEEIIAAVSVDDDSIDYTLDAANPGEIDGVTFDVTADGTGAANGNAAEFLASTEVFIQLVDGGAWTPASDCALTGGASTDTVTCTLTTPVNVEDVDQFRVVVAD